MGKFSVVNSTLRVYQIAESLAGWHSSSMVHDSLKIVHHYLSSSLPRKLDSHSITGDIMQSVLYNITMYLRER